MRDQINGQLYDIWKTDCDDYQHCIIPADKLALYSGYDAEWAIKLEADFIANVSNKVNDAKGEYRPLSAKYTY